MQTREEKLFVSMQQRLQQAALNDRERRTLLAQLESRIESQKVLVRFCCKQKSALIEFLLYIERYICYSNLSSDSFTNTSSGMYV